MTGSDILFSITVRDEKRGLKNAKRNYGNVATGTIIRHAPSGTPISNRAPVPGPPVPVKKYKKLKLI